MKITTPESKDTLEGTPQQLVGFLWHQSFLTEATPGKYMQSVAARLRALGDAPPRTDSAIHFLTDLAQLGVITILD